MKRGICSSASSSSFLYKKRIATRLRGSAEWRTTIWSPITTALRVCLRPHLLRHLPDDPPGHPLQLVPGAPGVQLGARSGGWPLRFDVLAVGLGQGFGDCYRRRCYCFGHGWGHSTLPALPITPPSQEWRAFYVERAFY